MRNIKTESQINTIGVNNSAHQVICVGRHILTRGKHFIDSTRGGLGSWTSLTLSSFIEVTVKARRVSGTDFTNKFRNCPNDFFSHLLFSYFGHFLHYFDEIEAISGLV